MAAVEADIQTHLAELSETAFTAFSDDIAGMFGATIECTPTHFGAETVKSLRKSFKKLTAVHLIEATGVLNGAFYLMFDQGGLFVLSGVIVMLPEKKILTDIKRGSAADAENLTDATREVGNLLVGSWERVFREERRDHEHFRKTATLIGEPWDGPDEVAVSSDEEVMAAVFEMKVDSYPAFKCAAVFPKVVLEKPAAARKPAESDDAGEVASASEPARPSAEAAPVAQTPAPAPEKTSPAVDEAPAADAGPPVDPPEKVIDEPDAQAGGLVGIPDDIRSIVNQVVGDVGEVVSEVAGRIPAETARDEPNQDYVERILASGSSQRLGVRLTELPNVTAKEIMSADVVWSEPDDTVQDVLAKMQQHNTGYVLIGSAGVPQGLVSNSNILGAVSPYLRPMFAKWRRPEDDATLGIKVKWIMSRPVRTVNPDATLVGMIENMRRYGGRCLPVVDGQAKVQGIVTVFDILLCVLGGDKSFSWHGRAPQAPPLLI